MSTPVDPVAVPAPLLTPPDAAPSPTRTARPTRSFVRHHRVVIAVVLTVLYVAVRLLFLTADPPRWLPNGGRVYELFSDPAAKSFEARNWALFGEWQTSPNDNYQFWRLQAPVWVYPLAGFYRLFGVGYAQMRIFSILCSGTGLVAMLALAAKKLRGRAFFASGAFLTFNYYYIIYGRSGLLEALLNTFLILTIYALYRSREHFAWIFAAQWALVAAFLTKQSGLFLAPLAVVAGIVIFVQQIRRGLPLWLKIAPIAHALAVIGGLAWYVTRDAYWRTVAWNYGHVMLNKDGTEQVKVKGSILLDVLDRLRIIETWTEGFFFLFPVAGTLAVVELFFIVRDVWRRRFRAWDLLVAGWLLSGFGALLFSQFLWVHYRLILFPPVFLLAGSFLQRLPRFARMKKAPGRATRLTWLLLAGAFVTHAVWFTLFAIGRRYEIPEAAAKVQKAIEGTTDPVLVGMWVPPILFETPYKYYYVKVIFNRDDDALRSFKVTHLLQMSKNDVTGAVLQRTFPEAMSERKPITNVEVRGTTLTLYEFPGTLQ